MTRKKHRVVVEVSFNVAITEKHATQALQRILDNVNYASHYANTFKCKQFARVANKLKEMKS